jgi:hypothetical protein
LMSLPIVNFSIVVAALSNLCIFFAKVFIPTNSLLCHYYLFNVCYQFTWSKMVVYFITNQQTLRAHFLPFQKFFIFSKKVSPFHLMAQTEFICEIIPIQSLWIDNSNMEIISPLPLRC